MPIFRPTAQVRLQLRIDEGAETESLRKALEKLPPDPTGKGGQVGLPSKDAQKENFTQRLQLEVLASRLPAPGVQTERARLDKERTAQQKALMGDSKQQNEPQALQN